MRRLILFLLLFSPACLVLAQTWEAGVSAGASGYMGDINPVKFYKFTDPAFGGLVKRNFNGYWSAKGGLMQAKIQGDDSKSTNPDQINRNLNFRSDITELSLQVEFNFFNYLPGLLPGFGARRFSPFIFTGVSGFSFDPVTDDASGEEIELRPLQTEAVAYKKHAISIPYGAGVKYNLKGNWNIIGEIGYRTAFTDYLDDLSGRYPDFGIVNPASPVTPIYSDRSVPTNPPGQQRGDFRKRDTYMITAISLTYTFVPVKCPTF